MGTVSVPVESKPIVASDRVYCHSHDGETGPVNVSQDASSSMAAKASLRIGPPRRGLGNVWRDMLCPEAVKIGL